MSESFCVEKPNLLYEVNCIFGFFCLYFFIILDLDLDLGF